MTKSTKKVANKQQKDCLMIMPITYHYQTSVELLPPTTLTLSQLIGS